MTRLLSTRTFEAFLFTVLTFALSSNLISAPITLNSAALKPVKHTEIEISLTAELVVPVTQFSAKNKTLIIWLPSEFGIYPDKQKAIASGLAARGADVWYANFQDAYFIQRGRASVDKFQAKDISALMLIAIKRGYTKIVLTGSGAAARPILRTVRYWQTKNKHLNKLGGVILFHPSLYGSRPNAGIDAQYIPETSTTNIPVYILQPTYSTVIYRVSHLLKEIRTSGAPVWIQFLHDIKDGFQVNIERHLRPIDKKVRRLLPGHMISAIQRMSQHPIPAKVIPFFAGNKKITVKDTPPGLKPYKKDEIRALTLNDISDKKISIKSFRGEVLLVSFWASWCPPCIREMPSINRLAQHFKGRKFRVVSVNIGESKADIKKFLNKHALLGEVLMDPDKIAYRAWKIFVIPSNFIIGKDGKMRYSSVGAVDWDTKRIRKTVDSLILE